MNFTFIKNLALAFLIIVPFSACWVQRTTSPKDGLSSEVEESQKLPSAMSEAEGMKGARCHFIYTDSECNLPNKSNEESLKYYNSHFIRCGKEIDLSYSQHGQFLYQLRDTSFVHAPDKSRRAPVDLERGTDFAELFSFTSETSVTFDTLNNKKVEVEEGTIFDDISFYITHKRASNQSSNGQWVCEICLRGGSPYKAKSCNEVTAILNKIN